MSHRLVVLPIMTQCPNKFVNYILIPGNQNVFVANGPPFSTTGRGN